MSFDINQPPPPPPNKSHYCGMFGFRHETKESIARSRQYYDDLCEYGRKLEERYSPLEKCE